MKNLEKQLRRLHEFPRADQTMFHFWRGRIYLSQQKLRPVSLDCFCGKLKPSSGCVGSEGLGRVIQIIPNVHQPK